MKRTHRRNYCPKCSQVQNGVAITKQAVKNRLQGCAPFLKEILKEVFQSLYFSLLTSYTYPLSQVFSDVKIIDSTIISLPDNVKEHYRDMGERNTGTQIDTWIYIDRNKDKRLKVRLVGERLPSYVASTKVKKEIAKNKDKDISARKRCLLQWNLAITNVNHQELSVKIILELYCVR